MATALGRWLVGTRYRETMGADDPSDAAPLGDFIVAGPGNDYLIGDLGADVFGFNPGDGQDFIDHFTPGEDKIQFGGGLSAASLTIRPETLVGVPGLAIYYAGPGGPDAVFLARVSALQPGDVVFETLPGTFFDPPARDFDNDFKSDVVLRHTDGSVTQWRMNGAAIAASAVIANPGDSWNIIATGDFFNDWKVDLLLQNRDGAPALWNMDGATIVAPVTLTNPGPQWRAIGSGHFYEDAAADILFRHDDGSIAIWQITDSTIVGNSIAATAATAIVANPGPAWKVVGIGDFNEDTKSDILLQHTDGSLALWQMNGATIAAGSVIGSLTAGMSVAGTGDFDGNDRDDILVRQADGTVTMWTMKNGAIVGTANIASPGTAWNVVGTGDYDGDGKDDILLQNSDGTVAQWLMNGTVIASSAVITNPGLEWQVV
jgi:hypothetical protein